MSICSWHGEGAMAAGSGSGFRAQAHIICTQRARLPAQASRQTASAISEDQLPWTVLHLLGSLLL